jgi:hypothetical protein
MPRESNQNFNRGTGILPVTSAQADEVRTQPESKRTRHGQDARATITRFNRVLLVLCLLPLSGCTAYTTARLHLTDQARKGVAIWSSRESAHDAETRAAYAAKRQALDAAFDTDIRAQTQLDPAWVIESRRAYAAGLTLLNQSEANALATNESARRDAAATDEALAKLAWLLQIQSDANSLFTDVFSNPTKGGPR